MECLKCKAQFHVPPSVIKKGKGKYCSRKCSDQREPTRYWLGKKRPEFIAWAEFIRTKQRKAEEHPHWKGNNIAYSSSHWWIRKVKGAPLHCEHCGKTGGSSRQYHWSNKDHKYNREQLGDWQRLCASCHKIYDREHHYRD